jgi:simple sugar transport system ATP-binding protein
MTEHVAVPPPRLVLRGITKRYPTVVANDHVDLTVSRGEIHALLGENGAGKSTLMKIVYGAAQPDAGSIEWEGRPVTIRSPTDARRLGIGMVFQHFSLFETLTVAENIALALDEHVAPAMLATRIRDVSTSYGLPIDPHRLVHSMSVGERQRVEIVRCLLQAPRLLIMDEPTSVLTPQAVTTLFETLRRLAAEGVSILYISHKLAEVRALCDCATVMRGGRVTGTAQPKSETNESLARMMVGSEVPVCHPIPRAAGEARLELAGLSLASRDPFGTSLHDITLTVRSGEIVGIAGVSGNGQKELLAAISGESLSAHRAVRVCAVAAGAFGPAQRRKLGLSFVPEERLGRGAVPDMHLADNSVLTAHGAGLVENGLLRKEAARAFARATIDRFGVKCGGELSPARSLSGGNLQKFIVGREIRLAPKVMVVAQPTWGVDVGASQLIRQALLDLRDSGVAVLVISEELDELYEICDRLAVLYAGRLSPTAQIAQMPLEKVGVWMTAVSPLRRVAHMSSTLQWPLRLERRASPSKVMRFVSPLLAAAAMLLTGFILFSLLGKSPLAAFNVFFIEPIASAYGVGELFLKATPLMLCALGLAIGFRANVWNIGAEGQFIVGALAAGAIALFAKGLGSLAIPLMLLAGVLGGMAWAAIAAVLRTRFHTSEILVTLMLVYIAQLLLSYLVHGPWRDPAGFNFPQSQAFDDNELLSLLFEGARVNTGFILALLLAVCAWFFVSKTFAGYRMRVAGLAPAAAAYAGFSETRNVWLALLIGGGAAGLAGVCEVAGPVGLLSPSISPGYGFAAIIVAFVGRLHPLGIVLASLLMSALYLGGEAAQIEMQLPAAVTGLFQGVLLFYLLTADLFIDFRLRRVRRGAPVVAEAAVQALDAKNTLKAGT